jgi:hypothetical protein
MEKRRTQSRIFGNVLIFLALALGLGFSIWVASGNFFALGGILFIAGIFVGGAVSLLSYNMRFGRLAQFSRAEAMKKRLVPSIIVSILAGGIPAVLGIVGITMLNDPTAGPYLASGSIIAAVTHFVAGYIFHPHF